MKNILKWIVFIPISLLFAILGAGLFYIIIGFIDPILSFLSGIEQISKAMLLFITPFVFYYLLLISSYKIVPNHKLLVSNLYCFVVAILVVFSYLFIFLRQGFNTELTLFYYIKGITPPLVALLVTIFQLKEKQMFF